MQKKLIIPLFILLMAIMLIGNRCSSQTKYTDNEIKEYNDSLAQIVPENQDKDGTGTSSPPSQNLSPPEIRPKYPAGLKDNGTVTADRVYLEFYSEYEIVSVTANGRKAPNLTDATITTSGTYEVVVRDNQGQESTFTFTLNKE